MLINIVGQGMVGSQYGDNTTDMDAAKTAAKIRAIRTRLSV